tara:strand:- start:322 stop:1116 length:795 start_codon:yes stop_codon:yes gene_type:complete
MINLNYFRPKNQKRFDLAKSREKFKKRKSKNLKFLLEKRYSWMKKYLGNKKNIIELGSGNGLSKLVLNNKNILLTDIDIHDWIDHKIDMNKMKLEKKYLGQVDVFIINHSLHHCAYPGKLLKNLNKYLKKGGYILINDPEISFFFKFFLYILNHEGWSMKTNVFNFKKPIFNPKNPWVSDNAVAFHLFSNEEKFSKFFPEYEIELNKLNEFSIFLNSGGVVSESPFIPLNNFFLKILDFVDDLLIFLFPSVFALNRRIVLKKII